MLGLDINADTGKDLLIGLRVATQSFSVNVSPESFEAGAICLRATQPEMTQPVGGMTPPPIESIERKEPVAQPTNVNPLPTA